MALPEYSFMSVNDYLALDNNSHDARYEYLDGEVKMLAGGSTYHSALISRLGAVLERSLENSPYWTIILIYVWSFLSPTTSTLISV
jgi:hypothetical protein